jgi:uncharacterized protein
MKTTIAIFAKPPVAGAAKTRLIPALGAEGAASLASAMLRDLWGRVATLEWAQPVLATTDATWNFGLGDVPRWSQGDGDLGARIAGILRRALDEGNGAIALGADSPDVPIAYLQQAQEALVDHDAVLGPSHDGGFYLLGVRRMLPGLLADLPWSTPNTREAVAERIVSMGLSLAYTPAWYDIDEPSDLARLHPERAPESARTLKELGFGDVTPS